MRRTNIFDWIKKNELQLTWLSNYLKQRFPVGNHNGDDDLAALRNSLISDIEYFCGSNELRIFVTKMKAAWLQYERRNKKKALFKTLTVELKKRVFGQVEAIAKKYNVPVNYAIEQLLAKACELEAEGVNQYKRQATLKQKIEQERRAQAEELGLTKVPDKESEICFYEELQEEMYRTHALTLDLIAYADKKSTADKESLIKDEEKRYLNKCAELNIEPVLDNSKSD